MLVQSTINPEGVALFSVSWCTVKVPTLTEGVTSTVVPLPGVSKYAVQSTINPEGVALFSVSNVLSKYQHLLRESRNSGCQVFSNCTVKVPTLTEGVTVGCLRICCQSINIWLRELYLFVGLFPSVFYLGAFHLSSQFVSKYFYLGEFHLSS